MSGPGDRRWGDPGGLADLAKTALGTLQKQHYDRCENSIPWYDDLVDGYGYRRRLLDQRIEQSLASSGGLLLEGARAVGKTTTALKHANSSVRLDQSPDVLQQATLIPGVVLEGTTPRLVDEWQLAPNLWNAARYEIDERRLPGQFIFAGSASPADDQTRHTGAGRFARLTLRPMALCESDDSGAKVPFTSLFDGQSFGGLGGPSVPDYADLLVRGGWPGLLNRSAIEATHALQDYLRNIATVDLRNANLAPDPVRMSALLLAVARNTSTEATVTKLAREAELEATTADPRTVRSYLDQLTRVFILDELAPWRVHLRSSIALRVKPKWHFVDPSLAAAALRATPGALLKDMKTFGLLFESMVIRDLRAFADMTDCQVFYYRDSTGYEVDAIVERYDGQWAGVEVKLGGQAAIDEAAAGFAKLETRLTPEKWAQCRSLNIITAGQSSYRRPDGINVIALAHLYDE